jgi:hypothetical protein
MVTLLTIFDGGGEIIFIVPFLKPAVANAKVLMTLACFKMRATALCRLRFFVSMTTPNGFSPIDQ